MTSPTLSGDQILAAVAATEINQEAMEGRSSNLRQKTAFGLAWMISQSLATKFASLLGQLALAYLLLPEHFAVISLACTVTAFVRVLENGGLREVLVLRETEFAKWANAAFWLSFVLGCLSTVLIAALAVPAAAFYGIPELRGIILGLAITPILSSLATLPLSRLSAEHRFGDLAGLAALQGISQVVVTVGAALAGWEAWSFVAGTVIAALLQLVAAWRVAPSLIRFSPQLDLWQSLWTPTLILSLVGLVTTIIQQMDYLLLGYFQTEKQVGYYFFAFSLATQTTQILGSNLAAVFLPVLSRIQNDSQRQLQGSLRAFHLLAGVGIPLAFLQTSLTDPGFRLVLPEKWLPAIGCTQVLSLGLGLNLLSSLCWSLLKIQGRFSTILWLNTFGAVLFSTVVGVAAAYGSPLMVAWCVVGFCALYSPLVLWLSIARIGGTCRDVVAIFAVPVMASAAAMLAAVTLGEWVPETAALRLVWQIVAITAVFCALYATALWLTGHPGIAETKNILATRFARGKPGPY